MKRRRLTTIVTRLLPASVLLAGLPARGQAPATLAWRESGIRKLLASYRPHPMNLTSKVPAGLKKSPAGLEAPLYGTLLMGPPASQSTIIFIVETKDGEPSKLFVDGNANGDLTDEPAHDWVVKDVNDENGRLAGHSYNADATVQVPFASGTRAAHIQFNHYYRKARGGDPLPNLISYNSDYGYVGEVAIGGRNVPAVLDDAQCAGNINVAIAPTAGPLLWLDLNGDGRQERNELVAGSRPFQADGKWWAIADVTPDGSLKIAPSDGPVAPAPKPTQAKAFTAETTDGKPVQFPADYKGKVVLIDFWATWCAPCRAEVPHVVEAYEKFHGKGFEILSISADKPEDGAKLAAFTKEHAMPWPQIHEAERPERDLSKAYDVTGIPQMFLVDGDTGRILAQGPDLRGPGLLPAVEKACADKGVVAAAPQK